VPTIAEQGIKDFESYNWNGVLAPAGTHPAIINRIAEVVSKQLATQDARALYSGQGHEASGITATCLRRLHPCRNRKMGKNRPCRQHPETIKRNRNRHDR